jgi:hypothetical protein
VPLQPPEKKAVSNAILQLIRLFINKNNSFCAVKITRQDVRYQLYVDGKKNTMGCGTSIDGRRPVRW